MWWCNVKVRLLFILRILRSLLRKRHYNDLVMSIKSRNDFLVQLILLTIVTFCRYFDSRCYMTTAKGPCLKVYTVHSIRWKLNTRESCEKRQDSPVISSPWRFLFILAVKAQLIMNLVSSCPKKGTWRRTFSWQDFPEKERVWEKTKVNRFISCRVIRKTRRSLQHFVNFLSWQRTRKLLPLFLTQLTLSRTNLFSRLSYKTTIFSLKHLWWLAFQIENEVFLRHSDQQQFFDVLFFSWRLLVSSFEVKILFQINYLSRWGWLVDRNRLREKRVEPSLEERKVWRFVVPLESKKSDLKSLIWKEMMRRANNSHDRK